MPILHLQLNGTGQAPDGSQIHVPPAHILTQRGPVVQVNIGLAQIFADQLAQMGQAVPGPTTGLALIDTGASSTCIDDSMAQRMGLPAIDVVQMTSASHENTLQNVYPARLELPNGLTFQAPRAMGAALQGQGIIALIGRDFLQHCTLFYNGITGEITLSL